MTDNDKNMRTLIVSFVVAIMFMVPLRFVEVTQLIVKQTDQVLGEMTSYPVKEEIVEPEIVLEAPYDEIEAETVTDCITIEESKNQIEEIVDSYGGSISKLSDEEITIVYNAIKKVDDQICR